MIQKILKILILSQFSMLSISINGATFENKSRIECAKFIAPPYCFRSLNPQIRSTVKRLMSKSFASFSKQKYLRAFHYAKQANALAPQLRSALGMMSISLSFYGNNKEALRYLNSIPRRYRNLNPFIFGYILFYNNKFASAYKYFKSVPKSSPYYSLSEFYLAVSLIKNNFTKLGFRKLRKVFKLPHALNSYRLDLLRQSTKKGIKAGILPPIIDLPYLVNFVGENALDFLPKGRKQPKTKKGSKILAERASNFVYNISLSGQYEIEKVDNGTLGGNKSENEKMVEAEVVGSIQYLIPFHSNGLTLSLASAGTVNNTETEEDKEKYTSREKSISLTPKFSLGLNNNTIQMSQKFEVEDSIEDDERGTYRSKERLFSIYGEVSSFSYQFNHEYLDEKYRGEGYDSNLSIDLDVSFQTEKFASNLVISQFEDLLLHTEGQSYSLNTIFISRYLETKYEYYASSTSFNGVFEEEESRKNQRHTLSLTLDLLEGSLIMEGALMRESLKGFMVTSETEEDYLEMGLDGIKDSIFFDFNLSLFEYFSISASHTISKYKWQNLKNYEGTSGFNAADVVSKGNETIINFGLDLAI